MGNSIQGLDAMPVEATTQTRLVCPSCGTKGRRVGLATLRALLKEEFVREFSGGEQASCDAKSNGDPGCSPLGGDTGWRFCDSLECDVVYFSETSDRTFLKCHLHVPVGVKEKAGDRPLCYCFGHSVATITSDAATVSQLSTGLSTRSSCGTAITLSLSAPLAPPIRTTFPWAEPAILPIPLPRGVRAPPLLILSRRPDPCAGARG